MIELTLVTFLWIVVAVTSTLVARQQRSYLLRVLESDVPSASSMTGFAVASRLLRLANLSDVAVGERAGDLTDRYDPCQRLLGLSPLVARSGSLAAMGIAAHEVGHAMEAARATRWSRVDYVGLASATGVVATVVLIGSWAVHAAAGAPIGLALLAADSWCCWMIQRVERRASARALELLRCSGLVSSLDLDIVRQFYDRAALTYLAAPVVGLAGVVEILLAADWSLEG